MDDTFRVRVEKIFGSLTSSSSQQPFSSLQSTLWSLTDDEVERREWRRDAAAPSHRDELPCSSSFDEFNRSRRRKFHRQLGDDEDKEYNTLRSGGVAHDDVDEWDIRSSIGLDRTLDNEEEEDEYDKVASGMENSGERLYMNIVTNRQSYLNIDNVVPRSSHGTKDRRANHMAAKIRLQEDEAEGRRLSSQEVGDVAVKELCVNACHDSGRQLRSILKRKGNSSDSSSNKRVRFNHGCKIVCEEEAIRKAQATLVDSSSLNSGISDDDYMSSQSKYGIPDYLRNPCKYTCYSFTSSSEVEEKSNSQACMDFLKLAKGLKSTTSGSELKDFSADLPKSVTFIPKKKASEVKAVNCSSKIEQDEEENVSQSFQQMGLPVGIAAGESQESEAGLVEEGEPETNAIIKTNHGSQKATRKYRTKSISDESDP